MGAGLRTFKADKQLIPGLNNSYRPIPVVSERAIRTVERAALANPFAAYIRDFQNSAKQRPTP